MAASPDLRLRPSFDIARQTIGIDQEPVLVVDGVMERPEALIDYAARAVGFAPAWGPDGGFPGLRAPAPLDYVEALVRALSPAIEQGFGLGAVKLARAECFLSLVTLPPDQLAPSQRVPHIDTVDPLQFALLHYLCDERFGGTAFYRHRATGFEAIDAVRRPAYDAASAGERPGDGYITANSADYEQIASFDARLDRVLIYRSRLLHSGCIRAPELLSTDPRRGRLTANIFLGYRAR